VGPQTRHGGLVVAHNPAKVLAGRAASARRTKVLSQRLATEAHLHQQHRLAAVQVTHQPTNLKLHTKVQVVSVRAKTWPKRRRLQAPI
jgi:hypothetical protein